MSAPLGSDGFLSARLVCLLDLIERPAAALSRDGALLGTNQRFIELARHLSAAWPVTLSNLLQPEAVEDLAVGLRGSGLPEGGMLAMCRDGVQRVLRCQPLDGTGDLQLLVVDDSGPGDTVRASMRAESTLRHDLAGPLTAILGTAELLLIRDRGLPHEVRDALGQILDHCGRMTEMLARSRTMSRAADGGAVRE